MKKRRRVLALFISIFLGNRSLSDARWFYGKKRKIGKGNLYLTENRSSWNEIWCASDNSNYMCHICAKEIFRFELQLSSYWQNIKFSRYCPKFHIFTKIVIFKVYLQLFGPTLHPYKFYDRDVSGILFLIFASCEPLKKNENKQTNKQTNKNSIFFAPKIQRGSIISSHQFTGKFWCWMEGWPCSSDGVLHGKNHSITPSI